MNRPSYQGDKTLNKPWSYLKSKMLISGIIPGKSKTELEEQGDSQGPQRLKWVGRQDSVTRR